MPWPCSALAARSARSTTPMPIPSRPPLPEPQRTAGASQKTPNKRPTAPLSAALPAHPLPTALPTHRPAHPPPCPPTVLPTRLPPQPATDRAQRGLRASALPVLCRPVTSAARAHASAGASGVPVFHPAASCWRYLRTLVTARAASPPRGLRRARNHSPPHQSMLLLRRS